MLPSKAVDTTHASPWYEKCLISVLRPGIKPPGRPILNTACPATAKKREQHSMKNYKKLLLTAAALVFASSSIAAEKLTIGTEGAYPPFNLMDASGQVVGFDVEIGQALCAKMKVECNVVTSDWDGIIPALNAGKFDMLIASMSITEERQQAVDFTNPYYPNKLQFVAPKSVDFKTDKDSL